MYVEEAFDVRNKGSAASDSGGSSHSSSLGKKRSHPTGRSFTGVFDDEDVGGAPIVKKSRQERNRASARESRRRKQEQMDVLAQTIAELKAENLQLKAQISGADQVKKDDVEKYELTKAMEEMIEKQTPDKDISNLLEHFEFRHADYGEQRTTKVEYHLKQVQALLTPTETTKMVMWTLNQEQDFFKEEGEPGSVSALTGGGSLWAMLCHALNMTEEQKAQLISTRARFDEIWKLLQSSFSLVSELRDTMLAKNEALINEIRVIKSILTPAQVAKFVFWVANNAACIHMLNRVLAEQKPHHVLKDLV